MGAPVAIDLPATEQQEYERLCRSGKTPVRLRERLTIVLLANDGMNNGEIAQQLSISAHMAGRWRKRFAEHGLSAIEKNLPRGNNHGGKNTRAQARLRQKIIAKTTTEKPANATHWSTRTLAKELGTSHNFVAKVWRECGFKPHLISQFKISNDPHFAEKLEDVVGLYLSPPDNAAVFCVDEKSSIQALDRTQPGLPLKKGRAETMTHDYKRHGTSTLFAALDVITGSVIAECAKRHRHQEFPSAGQRRLGRHTTVLHQSDVLFHARRSAHEQVRERGRSRRGNLRHGCDPDAHDMGCAIWFRGGH